MSVIAEYPTKIIGSDLPSDPYHLTILRTKDNHFATKKWRWDLDAERWVKVPSFKAGIFFHCKTHVVKTLPEMVTLLEAVHQSPRHFVISGAPLPSTVALLTDTPDAKVRKLKNRKANADPMFMEVKRHYAWIDLDKIPLPDWADLVNDPDTVIEYAITMFLPPAFSGVTCWWQLSASAGFETDILNVHLFYWLSEPATNSHVKAVLQQDSPYACKSPYNAVQPFYVARPVVEGKPDPLQRRTGWRYRTQEVLTLPLLYDIPRKAVAPHDRLGTADPSDSALEVLGHGEGGDGFHGPLRTETLRYARRCSRLEELRDDDAEKERLRCAIRAAPRRPGSDVETPYCTDLYLGSLINGAFNLLANEALGPEQCEPPPTRPTMDSEAATAILDAATADFVEEALAASTARLQAVRDAAEGLWPEDMAPRPPDGPTVLLAAGLGVGKTEVALRHTASFLSDSAHRVNRPPRRVLFVAPSHSLATNVADRFRAMAPEVPCHLHLGASQADPSHPDFNNPDIPADDKTKMCRRAAMVEAVTEASGGISTLCGSPERGYCPHHPNNPDSAVHGACGRLRAKMPASGLVILAGPNALTDAPHAALSRTIGVDVPGLDETGKPITHRKRAGVDPVDFIIADEPKPLSWLARPKDVNLAKLAVPMGPFPGGSWDIEREIASVIVSESIRDACNCLAASAQGPLCARDVRRLANLRSWGDVRTAAFRILPQADDFVRANMGEAEIAGMLSRLKDHAAPVFGVIRLCETIIQANSDLAGHSENALSGLLSFHNKVNEHRILKLRGVSRISPRWAGIPTLLLDGTADTTLLSRWFPNLTVAADVQLATPKSVTRRQIWNSAFGYTSWAPEISVPPQPNTVLNSREINVWNNVKWLMRLLTVRTSQFRGQGSDGIDVLAVLPLATEKALKALWAQSGGMPPGLALEHWNAIRGLDQYRNVRCEVLVSRPLPPTEGLETMAWTLTGVRGETVPGGLLPETDGAYLMADGTGRRAKVRRHPNPLVESVKRACSDDELSQGEGRGRGVRRDDNSPLLVEILTNVALPLPINELITRADLESDASYAAWLVANGVCPVPGERGFAELIATVEGKAARAIEDRLLANRACMEPLNRLSQAPPLGWTLFRIRLTKDDRYALPVWVDAVTPAHATAKLFAVGVSVAEIKPATLDIRVDPFVVMEARGAIYSNPHDAVLMEPDLFITCDGKAGSLDAAKKVYKTGGWTEYNDPIDIGLTGSQKVTFQVAGPGRRPREALVWPQRLPGFRTELETAMGTLVRFEIQSPEVVDPWAIYDESMENNYGFTLDAPAPSSFQYSELMP